MGAQPRGRRTWRVNRCLSGLEPEAEGSRQGCASTTGSLPDFPPRRSEGARVGSDAVCGPMARACDASMARVNRTRRPVHPFSRTFCRGPARQRKCARWSGQALTPQCNLRSPHAPAFLSPSRLLPRSLQKRCSIAPHPRQIHNQKDVFIFSLKVVALFLFSYRVRATFGVV